MKLGCTVDSAHARVQVAKALAYLHEANPQLLHRDLKSENLLLTERGRTGDIRVMDFGLTKLRSASPAPLALAYASVPIQRRALLRRPSPSLMQCAICPERLPLRWQKLGCTQCAADFVLFQRSALHICSTHTCGKCARRGGSGGAEESGTGHSVRDDGLHRQLHLHGARGGA